MDDHLVWFTAKVAGSKLGESHIFLKIYLRNQN